MKSMGQPLLLNLINPFMDAIMKLFLPHKTYDTIKNPFSLYTSQLQVEENIDNLENQLDLR